MQKTVLILAGGKSQRFQSKPLQGLRGRGAEPHNKCLITLKNKPLIQHVIDNLSGVADEIIVAARDEQQGEQIRDKIPAKILLVFDSLRGFGPLAGALSGLERASFPYSLVIGCDMPFINEYVVEFLFEVAERGNYDAVVPRWENGMVEPLHAVYKKEPTLTAIKDAIKQGDNRIFTILSHLKNVNFLPVNKIREIDSDLKTFRNINTPEELEKCLK
jgi:molybdopterin-guanine dinucleotide biosynthesis protein A